MCVCVRAHVCVCERVICVCVGVCVGVCEGLRVYVSLCVFVSVSLC